MIKKKSSENFRFFGFFQINTLY